MVGNPSDRDAEGWTVRTQGAVYEFVAIEADGGNQFVNLREQAARAVEEAAVLAAKDIAIGAKGLDLRRRATIGVLNEERPRLRTGAFIVKSRARHATPASPILTFDGTLAEAGAGPAVRHISVAGLWGRPSPARASRPSSSIAVHSSETVWHLGTGLEPRSAANSHRLKMSFWQQSRCVCRNTGYV